MNLISEISQSWSWVGLNPVEVVGENDFGNLIIKDIEGQYWRLCPEDCYCRVVASTRQELDALSTDQEFLQDWNMRAIVKLAKEKCGDLPEGKKYCLKIPGILGGEYGGDNLGTTSLLEMVRISGDLPARDLLMFTGSRNRQGLAKLRELAAKYVKESPYRLPFTANEHWRVTISA